MSQRERRDDERPIGSGVTTGAEPAAPGTPDPVPDPAGGQPRTGSDTQRRGETGLGTATGGSQRGDAPGSEVDASDVEADDAALADIPPSGALTRQDEGGAVDTKDPEGGARQTVQESNPGS